MDFNNLIRLKIWAETVVPIELFFLRKENISDPPKKLISHAVAIRQCSEFISALSEVEYNNIQLHFLFCLTLSMLSDRL